MLILVQERDLFFSTNENNQKISKDDEAKIEGLKRKLKDKIKKFTNSIMALEGNPKIDCYDKALNHYDEIREVAREIYKELSAYLFEPILKSLISTISYNIENLDPNEAKMKQKLSPVNENIYEKSFNLMSFNYLIAEAVN